MIQCRESLFQPTSAGFAGWSRSLGMRESKVENTSLTDLHHSCHVYTRLPHCHSCTVTSPTRVDGSLPVPSSNLNPPLICSDLTRLSPYHPSHPPPQDSRQDPIPPDGAAAPPRVHAPYPPAAIIALHARSRFGRARSQQCGDVVRRGAVVLFRKAMGRGPAVLQVGRVLAWPWEGQDTGAEELIYAAVRPI